MSDAPDPKPAAPIAGRSCDGCTLCCKLVPVNELEKPGATWCQHCEPGAGCRIYADRPYGCQVFYCGWMINGEVAPHWRPRDSRMVLAFQAAENRTVVHVDPGRPDAWRKPPYRAELQAVATRMAERGGYVLVVCGVNQIILLGRQEFPLGRLQPSDRIHYTRRPGAAGWVYDVKVNPGAPDGAPGIDMLRMA
jgi:hypothetical protein